MLSLVGDWNIVVSEASLVDVGINLILCGKLLLVLECIIKTAPVLNLVPQCCEMLCCVRWRAFCAS